MGEVVESFAERARRKRREQNLNWTPEDERRWLEDHPEDRPDDEPEPVEWDESLIPDLGDERSAEALEIDNFLDKIDIIDAYNRWAGKGPVEVKGSKREGIMIRCPSPQHVDNNPSAWINLDEQVYACGGCGMEGGDKFTIAAYSFGFQVPIPPNQFPELKKKMAESLGFQVRQVGTKNYVQQFRTEEEPDEPDKTDEAPDPGDASGDEDAEDDAPDNKSRFPNKPEQQQPLATVHSITPRPEDPDYTNVEMPPLDWQSMVHEGTFLERWMADANDHLPGEYYFWLGLMAIGLATSDRAVIRDNPVVKGNLFVCLTGASGIGKSRAVNKLRELLTSAVPEGDHGRGVRQTLTVASAEALIDSFVCREKADAQTDENGIPREDFIHHSVTGLVKFNELSLFMGKAKRQGSTLKPVMMDMFDAYGDVTDVSRTHGKIVAKEPFASLISTTQPDSIRTLLVGNDTESGFVNRWVFVGGITDIHDVMDDANFDPEPSAERLKRIAERWPENHGPRQHYYSYTDDARNHFQSYYENVLWPLKQSASSALFARCDLMIKKTSMLLAIDRHLDQIDLKCVQDAISLWEYAEKMYKIIGTTIGLGDFDYCKQAVIKTIEGFKKRQGKGPKPKQLIAKMNRDTKFSSDLIDKVVQSMTRLGELEEASYQTQSGDVYVRYELASTD